jgi:hypothetical protein
MVAADLGRFVVDNGFVEARPSCEKTIFDGFEPTRSSGAIAASV